MAFLLDALYERTFVEQVDRFKPQILHKSGYLWYINDEIVLQSPIAGDTQPPTYHYMIYNTFEKFTSYCNNCCDALLAYRQSTIPEKTTVSKEKTT